MEEFDFDELIEIQSALSEHHLIFQTFWNIGAPIITKTIATAAVGFDNEGKVIHLILNPDFWNSLDLENKLFVISHECLHIILNHGKRGQDYKDKSKLNQAMDIVINEMLVSSFGFNKFNINNWENFCFVETIFDQEAITKNNIHKYGSFEYYLKLMEENKIESDKETVDQHSNSGCSSEESDGEKGEDDTDEAEKAMIEDLIKNAEECASEMNESLYEEVEPTLSNEEKQDFGKTVSQDLPEEGDSKNKQAGTTAFGKYLIIPRVPVKKVKKWEQIVKNQIRSIVAYHEVEKESWVCRNRRSLLLDESLMMPGDWPQEVPEKAKYNLVFFLDASGSCNSHAQDFVKLLRSIPEEIFEIHAYSFDTRLYKIDLSKDGVQGWGGTSFTILDREIRKLTEEKRHPDAIFVLSDGDGDRFFPEKPKKWHWILTPRHSTRLIPNDSKKHKMAEFK